MTERPETDTPDDRTEPPDTVWVDVRLAVRPSPMEGHGLFATDVIAARTTVIRLGGHLVSSVELESLIAVADEDPDAPYVDTISVHDDAHLVLPPRTAADFCNHSCDPTAWLVGPYDIATRRALAPGDELTIDYGTISGAEGFEMDCRCGLDLCRGRISSDDWRRRNLQQRYAGHWVPALEARISRSRDRPGFTG